MNGVARLILLVLVGTLWLSLPAQAQKKGGAVTTPGADLKWNDIPGFPGLKMAVVQGDPGKGASHFFLKFPAAFAAPVHHHTANHYVTVLTGTLVLTIDGKDAKLPAGSYFSFTDKKPHATKCDAGAECVLFIDARGKWDVVADKPKKGEAKK
jgi:quercetin dioxygenase-like cupin family protein